MKQKIIAALLAGLSVTAFAATEADVENSFNRVLKFPLMPSATKLRGR